MLRISLITVSYAVLVGLAPPAAGQQRVERRLTVGERTPIRVHNLTGSTTVRGWAHDSVVLTGTLPAGATLYFGGSAGGVKGGVELADPADTMPAHLELRVPRGARVWIKSASGDITVEGVSGGLDVYTVSGRVSVRGAAAELTAESMDGAVTVEAGRWARVKTASGAIAVTGGEDVGVATVTGAVTYAADAFRRARLESVSGDLTFRGAVPRGSRLELESHGGQVTVEVPAALSAEIAITTFQGEVHNAFGSQSLRPLPDQRGRALEFTAGTGGADLIVRTFKGDVRLLRASAKTTR
ncbi:MAG: DUF4097 domain-containing protein [Gemmatimonadota bacterium]|nr:DUF4097 domain-containing protein [Gemmatimonadota bacterium]